MATTVHTGSRAQVGFTDFGQLMNNGPALSSIESDGTYEHLGTGELDEGYAIFYKDAGGSDHTAYDVFTPISNITRGTPQIVRNDALELVKLSASTTIDQLIAIRQCFTWSTNATRVDIKMQFTNTSNQDLRDLLIKRYADIDVDTGGTRGWASYRNHWRINRDSVMAYNNPSEAPAGHKSHIVNMVAMPGDLLLFDAFAGLFGTNQYNQRVNANPNNNPAARLDGIGVLEWHGDVFRSGETIRLHCYYDTYCLCSDFANPLVGGGKD
jgi:hypothetical protein